VLEQIGRTLGAKGDLVSHIGARELVLVLDNLEQAIDAAPALADLVERCGNLQLLVTVFNLAYAALAAGDLSTAERRFAEAVQRPDIDPYMAARALAALGSVALRGGRQEEAELHLRRALALLADLEQRDDTLAWALELLGAALAGSEPERAAELLREAEELRQQLGLTLAGLELEQHEQAVATLETS
jgi:tetratricopeptide (TPR) repeat protein